MLVQYSFLCSRQLTNIRFSNNLLYNMLNTEKYVPLGEKITVMLVDTNTHKPLVSGPITRCHFLLFVQEIDFKTIKGGTASPAPLKFLS